MRRDTLVQVQASCLGEMPPPVGIVKSGHIHVLPAGRRLHETVMSDIYRHMRGFPPSLRKKNQIAAFQVLPGDGVRLPAQASGSVRKFHADASVTVLHQSAAIEATWRIAAISIRFADHGKRLIRRAAGKR